MPTARASKAGSTCGTKRRCSRSAARPPPSGTASPGEATGRAATSCSARWRAELRRPPEVEAARQALLARRDGRVRPGLDDKVLTEWNAMAVAALAEAGAALGVTAWVSRGRGVGGLPAGESAPAVRRPVAAQLASRFACPGRPDARPGIGPPPGLRRRPRLAGRGVHPPGRGDRTVPVDRRGPRRRGLAVRRCSRTAASGAFHMTGRDAEALIARPVDSQDGAVPSANSVAATALLRLAALTGEARYREHAEAVIDAMGPALAAAPDGLHRLGGRRRSGPAAGSPRWWSRATVPICSRCPAPLPARCGAGLGGALRIAAVGRADRTRTRPIWRSCAGTTPARRRCPIPTLCCLN